LKLLFSLLLLLLLLLLILLLLLTAVALSLGGSSPYTSTNKQIRINIHKRKNTKNTVQTIHNTVNLIYVHRICEAVVRIGPNEHL